MPNLYFNKNYHLLKDLPRVNTNHKFYSTDNQKTFKFNCKKFKNKNWEWKTADIDYSFNEYGYRTKEFNDVDNEFVLGLGCSYTEGVGIHNNDIWLNQYCDKLGIDRINLAKASAGMDIQYYNTLLWKNSKLPLPKLVICQWPQKFRKSFGFQEDDSVRLADMSETPTRDGQWWGKRYIIDEGEMSINSIAWYLGMNNTWKSLGVPVLNFSWEHDITEDLEFAEHKIHFIDPEGVGSMQARDCMHDGPEFHQITCEKLLNVPLKI